MKVEAIIHVQKFKILCKIWAMFTCGGPLMHMHNRLDMPILSPMTVAMKRKPVDNSDSG